MSEFDFEFEHEGRIVKPGQRMYVSPAYHWKAGESGRVERYYGDSVMLRHDNGAVPTVPLSALSWGPHPTTVAMEELKKAGFSRPSNRDIAIWVAARKTSNQTEPKE